MSEPKINDFHISLSVQNDVLQFDVAVSYFFSMHVVDSLKKLFEEEPSSWLTETFSHLDDLEEVNFTFFHHNSRNGLFLFSTLRVDFKVSLFSDVKEWDYPWVLAYF